jgi:hypothetical protein
MTVPRRMSARAWLNPVHGVILMRCCRIERVLIAIALLRKIVLVGTGLQTIERQSYDLNVE